MINYGKHFISKGDIKTVSKTLASDFLTQGPQIKKFENHLLSYFGGKYCKVVSNGTSALDLAVKSLNLKNKFNAVVPSNSFIATANCIKYNNGKVNFCDIDLSTFNICLNSLKKILKKKKIDLLIAVDFAGNPCDWKNIRKLATDYKFKIINDNCHAIGSKYKKSTRYAIKYADIVTQSYHSVKNITTGEGGSVITNNFNVYKKIQKLSNHSIEKRGIKYPWHYEINNLGYNYRLTDFQSSLGISQLKKLNRKINLRRKIAFTYDKFFKSKKNFQTQKISIDAQSSYHLYPVLFPFKNLKEKNNFFIYMRNKGVNLQTHYIPIYKHNIY
ncbi:DegT/DnrJ/EryC1/StrS family aminotransferase, partial [Candidatus Pelagibacter sp.]|nr:DegT/DnrJ/EryC1/StrS family aminotransferase [Candidatus Pelagibacter sp.]